ncbi:hypothetical protein ACFL0Z_02430 [Patescibacteria group bacterium]
MTIYTKTVLVAGLCAAFLVGGAFAMTSVGAATNLEDAASLSLDNTFNGIVNYFPKGITIGETGGEGGVTFFNGTIVNNSTGDVPVTIGDALRVDGKINRGATAGSGDTQPVWFDDNVRVDGNIQQGEQDWGTIKAAATVGNGGAVTQSIDNTSGGSLGVTVSKPTGTTGTYSVVFASDVSNNYIMLYPRGSSTAPTAASGTVSTNGKVVTVYIADVIGNALVDQAFNIAIF